ncbi:MAG: hypothetical protein ABI882_16445, partial [Acidobacteriota bacterium]
LEIAVAPNGAAMQGQRGLQGETRNARHHQAVRCIAPNGAAIIKGNALGNVPPSLRGAPTGRYSRGRNHRIVAAVRLRIF